MKTTEQVQSAWSRASIELNIEFHAPFGVSNGDEVTYFHGFLPHFGGPKGTVFMIDETFEEDRSKEGKIAQESGYYFSRISRQIYSEFSPYVFHEAMRDWGWYGEKAKEPKWMK